MRRSHLQSAVDHGVGASSRVKRLLFLQLHGVFGVESEEVDQLCGGVNLCLDSRLPLKQTTKPSVVSWFSVHSFLFNTFFCKVVCKVCPRSGLVLLSRL